MSVRSGIQAMRLSLNRSASKTVGRGRLGAGVGAAVTAILAAVFAVEGGYVNDPADPGGETNHGITKQVARQNGYTGPMRELKRYCNLDGAEVCANTILYRQYIVVPGFLPLVEIDPAVAEEVIDTAVNMGPPRPSRYLQRAINQVCGTALAVDGKVGPRTVGAYKDCRASMGPSACVRVLNSLDAQQEAEYDRLVRVNPALKKFRKGWQNHRIGNVDRKECWK